MKGDFSRSTFDPQNRYSRVRLQQGRVGLDADFNEQADLDAYLREAALADVVGPCGVPAGNAGSETGGGFKIEVLEDGDLSITAGRLYADGLQVDLLESDATYLDQPDLPGTEPPAEAGRYLVYLDAWRHHRTALEDPAIREVALGGPDTATRLRTVGQVKLLRIGDAGDGPTCATRLEPWDELVAPPPGTLEARTRPGIEPEDPCIVPSDAGYTRLENQLYRVEVHAGGNLGEATFKWSRENGSVVTAWLGQDGDELTVGTTGPDEVRGLSAGQWVELTDEDRELAGEPGLLVRITQVLGDDRIRIDAGGQAVDRADFANNPKLRRWDVTGDQGALPVERDEGENDGYLLLEGGIEVRFGDGLYRTGDFWWIPARAFVGDGHGQIEWPADDTDPTRPRALPPHGVEHHYCRLAVVDFDGEIFTGEASDCRPRFPSLTELTRLTPAGGDGQEALPGGLLPCPLTVAVANGGWPVAGARVRFTIDDGSGRVGGEDPASFAETFLPATGEDGLARCRWILPGDATAPDDDCFAVVAHLVDADGVELDTPPVVFHATTSLASRVGYEPGCDLLRQLQAFTVQDALDALCRNLGGREEGVRVERVELPAQGTELPHDDDLRFELLGRGIQIVLSEPVAADLFARQDPIDPILDVTAYPPVRPFINDQPVVAGFSPVVLAAQVRAQGPRLLWIPRPSVLRWLEQVLTEMAEQGDTGDRLLLRLTLRGHFVWAADDRERFLDGDAFGRPEDGRLGLRLPSGDGRRGGDFSTWFWVRRQVQPGGLVLTAVPIILGNNRSIGGFLADEQGNRIPGATFTLTGPVNQTAVGNADGAFSFRNLPPGAYVVRASVPGGGTVEQRISFSAGPGPVITPPVFEFTAANVPVAGIGRAMGARLIEADVRNLEDLALVSPQRLAAILNVSEDRARTFSNLALARLRGEEG